jgi:DNA-binding CsgD family transcriptional regulator
MLSLAGALSPASRAASSHGAGRAAARPVIVLEHGAWADASSWSRVIAILQREGYTVYAPPDPLRGLASDSAYLHAFLTQNAATLARHLSYARAVLADDGHAEEEFGAALRADLIRWPWLRARLELAYGSWLRRQRRVAESRPPLRSALTTFEVIGTGSWARQARAELRAAGERSVAEASPPGTPSPPDVLSAQELQIARLAAEGLSNREIGEWLYLSPRTVGSHLYRIFPKLEITSGLSWPAALAQPEPRDQHRAARSRRLSQVTQAPDRAGRPGWVQDTEPRLGGQ